MKVNVGSKNKVKIDAVKEAIRDYHIFMNAEVDSLEANSEVSNQPKSIEEIIRGAKNRAKNAFNNCNYSFGIEAGLMEIPGTETGYMNVTVCAIYNGNNYFYGKSQGFELPKETLRLILEEGLELDDAAYKSGLTKKPRIGCTESGLIGLLTKYRITRKELIKQAIIMALVNLENSNNL